MRAGGFPGNPGGLVVSIVQTAGGRAPAHHARGRGRRTWRPTERTAGARMVPPGAGNDARGDGRRGVGVSQSTAEAGELSPRDPVEGRGHRQVAPVEGKTANTPRVGPVSTSRHRIAELARHAFGMAVAIAWLPGPAGTRRRVAKLSVEEPDAAEPARPDLWGARVSNDPGLPDPHALQEGPRHVFPARAGMNQEQDVTVHHSARVPRAGGDEPTAGGPRLVGARCSVLVPVAVDSPRRYTGAMNAIDERACGKPGCDNFGKPGLNIGGHGWFVTTSGRRRRYRCTVCGGPLSTNTGTAYRGLRCSRREFDQVASLRVEGVSISATARVTGHSRTTIARWLERAATAAACFNHRLLRDFDVIELQADERCTFIGSKRRTLWLFATIEVCSRLWAGSVLGRRSHRNTKAAINDVILRGRRQERITVSQTTVYDTFERHHGPEHSDSTGENLLALLAQLGGKFRPRHPSRTARGRKLGGCSGQVARRVES